MNEKIMSLIELSMQFKEDGKILVTVQFASHINGISVSVYTNDSKVPGEFIPKKLYGKTCYLDWEDAEENLDTMKVILEEFLKGTFKEAV